METLEPGPMALEIYYPGDTTPYYAPGELTYCPGCSSCYGGAVPHMFLDRLEGPVRIAL